MRRRLRPATFPVWRTVMLAVVLASCSASTGATSAPPMPSSGQSPTPVAGVVSAADAVAIVLALDARFAGLGARDPARVGQGSWFEVTAESGGWRITVQLGWGDCPAGCISTHTWDYTVGLDGTVVKAGETGDPLPAPSGPPATAPVPIPAGGGPWLVGTATAGPVCPVERDPPDPACAPRPVVGAAIVVLDPGGRQVGQATTGADGTYRVAVPAGSVRVEAAPVAGLMGAPAPIDVVVPAGGGAWLRVDLAYDTGIR